MKLPKGVTSFRDEEWKDLVIDNLTERHKYKISNYGRIISYFYYKGGKLLKLGNVKGYKTFTVKDTNRKKLYFYVHRLVAEHFIKKTNPEQHIILHLDSNRHNNYYKNLKWATDKEAYNYHMSNNPELKKKFTTKGFRAYSKLTESDVKIIKRKLFDPKRKTKMKILARQFGVSEMQLYRIKSGENWSSVTPD